MHRFRELADEGVRVLPRTESRRGIHVADIAQAMDGLKARGVKFIDEQPRPGAHGSRIAFLHPASAGGLLIELKQPAAIPAQSGHQ